MSQSPLSDEDDVALLSVELEIGENGILLNVRATRDSTVPKGKIKGKIKLRKKERKKEISTSILLFKKGDRGIFHATVQQRGFMIHFVLP